MASVTQQDLDDFHRFASERLGSRGADVSWDELLIEWQSVRQRDAENAAICEGLADVDAHSYQPAAEAMEEVRKEFKFRE